MTGTSADTIGIIGLGQIGQAVAARYLETGVVPVVHDVRPDAVAALVAEGAVGAHDAADLARRSDVVLVAVRDDQQCRDAVTALLEGSSESTVIAVLSTVTPDTIAEVVAAGADRGVVVVDAPVAGQGRASIEAGTMAVLVGGSDEVVARLRPALAPWGEVLAAGPTGSGAALKLAHNVMVYVGYAAVAEALEVARVAGVRDGLVEEVTRRSGTLSAQSEIYLHIRERRLRGTGTPEEDEMMRISAALLDKDLGHAVALARAAGADLPVAALLTGTGEDVYVVDR